MTCACGCGAALTGPSDWFASEVCQRVWHSRRARPLTSYRLACLLPGCGAPARPVLSRLGVVRIDFCPNHDGRGVR